ncbi:hypothetical protein VNI00_005764 [Paramarasmius palmivorus]|uniref:DNA replication regulator Sld3 C-terminal domain-containing protein n=1 Tax=Paramarasmius palmivorus TaxID=297713 RepID=A0AAW0DEX2_9AGAR
MPLNFLVPALKRVNVASGSSQPDSPQPHPLHALLDPLLHTPRSAANKYNVELPRILSDGGGAGEIEETMMWYVLSYEKGDKEYEAIRDTSADGGIWEDEKWRKAWLQRLERREVQIQILLHLLILSLPGPPPPRPQSPEMSSVKRRKLPRKKPTTVPSTADRLEAFMDKLSTWQLMGDLNASPARNANKLRQEEEALDWMQVFYKETIFPTSPFTEDEDEDEPLHSKPSDLATRSSSPVPHPPPAKRPRTSSSASVTRYPSPALSTTSSHRSSSRPPEPRKLERTRSLSASLKEEEMERRRAQSVGQSSRRVLNREVSMSKSFKAKPPIQPTAAKTAVDPPVKPAPAVKSEAKNEGVTLVEATPMKPKETRVRTLSRTFSQTQTQTQLQLDASSPTKPKRTISRVVSQASTTITEEEEEWPLSGSSTPAILRLGGDSEGSELTDIEEDDGDDDDLLLSAGKSLHSALLSTPTKAGRSRN